MSRPEELRAALEDALADNPDDLATHHAYADLLSEQGDPRGEFIQVQLALEDEGRPPEERRRLQQRERELLAAHEREWLGELAPLLLGTPEERLALFLAEYDGPEVNMQGGRTEEVDFCHRWARGWLDSVSCSTLTVEMARKLGRAAIARLLRSLVYRCSHFFGYRSRASLFRYARGPDLTAEMVSSAFLPVEVLGSYPAIRNLRVFQFGREADPEESSYQDGIQFERLAPLVEGMPQLEELYIFGHIYPSEEGVADLKRLISPLTLYNLRIFQHYHGHTYPLEALAANEALGRLTHLLCFPHSFAREYDLLTQQYGDVPINRTNVRAVVTSTHLTALTHLQLRGSSGGDAMIGDIVASGILKRLKMLDLRHGLITDEGARALAACPDLRHLEVLDLTDNRLTTTGIAALQATGVRLVSHGQQSEPFDDDAILYCGDSE